MKKLTIFLIFLITALSLNAQYYSHRGRMVKGNGQFVTVDEGYSTEYQAIYDAMTTPPSTYDQAQDTLVQELKTAGVWAKGDVAYLLAQETNGGGEALINWIVPGTYNATDGNTTTFTANEGFTGDGASDYLNTNYDPSTNATNFAQNDATIAIYVRTDRAQNWGNAIGGTNITLYPWAAASIYTKLNQTTESNIGVANSYGFYATVRSAVDDVRIFKNGTKLDTETIASSAVAAGNIRLLSEVGAAGYSIDQISFVFIGGALTDTEVTDMNTAVEKYMDRIGKGVQ